MPGIYISGPFAYLFVVNIIPFPWVMKRRNKAIFKGDVINVLLTHLGYRVNRITDRDGIRMGVTVEHLS